MLQEFAYPEFDSNGVKILTRVNGVHGNMLQNITVYRLQAEQSREFYLPDEEIAILLIEGEVEFFWESSQEKATRENIFKDGAYCLHLSCGKKATIKAIKNSEILVQSTINHKSFESHFYTPENTKLDTFGQGVFEGKAQRSVRTFFDYNTAPYSNMVCGDLLIPQGGWSSYPPHHHPQPEVYFYRFDKPQGFGACIIDDNAYVIKDGSFAAIPGGKCHPQVNAPGYPMYIVWMIRHFEDDPWRDRIFDPAHAWLLEEK